MLDVIEVAFGLQPADLLPPADGCMTLEEFDQGIYALARKSSIVGKRRKKYKSTRR